MCTHLMSRVEDDYDSTTYAGTMENKWAFLWKISSIHHASEGLSANTCQPLTLAHNLQSQYTPDREKFLAVCFRNSFLEVNQEIKLFNQEDSFASSQLRRCARATRDEWNSTRLHHHHYVYASSLLLIYGDM